MRIQAEYTTNADGDCDGQVIKDPFWMSPKQIKITQQFASSFICKTDATFNANSLKLPLSVIVSINNYRKTFFIAYCYITLELVMSFKFVAN